MSNTVIDTLAYAEQLEEAGVQRTQAEAMARALNDALVTNLATKTDLAQLENRLTWRLLGGMTVLLTIAVSLIRLLDT